MKLYADSSVRRTRQLFGDVLLVVWMAVWVEFGLVVRDATLTLAEPGEQIAEAGGGLAQELRDAADRLAAAAIPILVVLVVYLLDASGLSGRRSRVSSSSTQPRT